MINPNPSRVIHTVLALAVALATSACGASLSATPESHISGMMAKMNEGCQEMKDKKQKLKEDVKADDADLAARLDAMNGARPGAKVDLTAAVVTLMAKQRIAMTIRKAEMEEAMMKHMMMHMKMGKDSAARGPMMQDAKDPAPEGMKTTGTASPRAGGTLVSRE